MLAKLGSWIKDFTEDETAAPTGDAEWAQTLAGLLVEAASWIRTRDARSRGFFTASSSLERRPLER